MASVAFIGTFDPFHGAHIGQLLRAYHYKNFTKAYILVDKHPPHKPNASNWEDRVAMAQLSLSDVKLPFAYEVVAVNNSLAEDFSEPIDYKVCGIDSLIDTLQDPERVSYALRWPMIVLSIPGIAKNNLTKAVADLPESINANIHYEYVNIRDSKLLNYNFDLGEPVDNTIVHSSFIRSGQNSEFIAPSVRTYLKIHQLYVKTSR